jgi:hypothetical protein
MIDLGCGQGEPDIESVSEMQRERNVTIVSIDS